MRVQRLLHMDAREILTRARQHAWRWLDRVRLGGRLNGSSDQLARLLTFEQQEGSSRDGFFGNSSSELGSYLLRSFLGSAPQRLFPGLADPELATTLRSRDRAWAEQTLEVAESLLHNQFDLLGYHALYFGTPPDWHLDPVSGRRAPLVHWTRLDPLDADVVGDSKVIWELNRHQWLVRLGLAYRLTRDERYATAFANHIQNWMQSNPSGVGINWTSSLEVAFRIISWSWTLLLFRHSPALTPELFLEILASIRDHAWHVEKYLSHYFSPNTHLTGEALGLFYAGLLFPEISESARWRTIGSQILIEESGRQILEDGIYFEHSTCYARYTADIYLHFLILAQRNDLPVPSPVADRVQRLLDALLTLSLPDGTMPQIGDSDGGWLLPLHSRSYGDLHATFSTAAALFNRSDYAWAAGVLAPETLWLLGPEGAHAFDALQPHPPSANPSTAFPVGGYVVMRDKWERDAHHLILDAAPIGCSSSGGHGHADLLSIQLCAFGEPFLIDAGTFCYTPEASWRDFFRSARAHSTLRIDAADQSFPAGPFKWASQPNVNLHTWKLCRDYEYADASHHAYVHLADPAIHRRRVVFFRSRFWLVVDDIYGRAEHSLHLQFQFANIQLIPKPDQWIHARNDSENNLFLKVFSSIPLQHSIHIGQQSPAAGWISSNYGLRQPAPMLVYSTIAPLPTRFVTVLCPSHGPSAYPPEVEAVAEDTTIITKVRFNSEGFQLHLFDSDVQIDSFSSMRAVVK